MAATVYGSHASLSIEGAELAHMFKAVLAHTDQEEDGDDWPLPQLTQVHLEVRGGNLRMVCTDRYTMAVVNRPVGTVSEGFRCSYALWGDQVRKVLDSIESLWPVALIVESVGVRIVGRDFEHVLKATKSELDWRTTLGKILAPENVPTTAFLVNPRFLARLDVARPLHDNIPFQFRMRGEDKTLVATLGDDFLALIAPVSTEGHEAVYGPLVADLDPWFDLIDED